MLAWPPGCSGFTMLLRGRMALDDGKSRVYEAPRALRLGRQPTGAGYCEGSGSGDADGCTVPGNTAAGQGCGSPGNSAILGGTCWSPGSSAEYCDPNGSSPQFIGCYYTGTSFN